MKIFEVSLENKNVPENAKYRDRYQMLHVRAESFSEAVDKALGARPGMEVTSITVETDEFIM